MEEAQEEEVVAEKEEKVEATKAKAAPKKKK